MNSPIVPKDDHWAMQVTQEHAQEIRGMQGVEVLFLKTQVEAHSLSLGGHCERTKRRNPIVLVIVPSNGWVPFRPPGPAACRNEQEAALIEEDEVGTKSLDFFL